MCTGRKAIGRSLQGPDAVAGECQHFQRRRLSQDAQVLHILSCTITRQMLYYACSATVYSMMVL